MGSIAARALAALAALAVTASLPAVAEPAAPTATPTAAVAGRSPTGAWAIAPVAGRLVRDFDPPAEPWGAGHRGVSLAAEVGETVVAAMAGTVAFAGEVAGRGWVTVDHGGGLATTYGALDPREVAVGQRVDVGDGLGRLAHGAGSLHWGARQHGAYIHPLGLLATWRVRLVVPEPG